MITLPNMRLVAWSADGDYYSHGQLATNWSYVDNHDHSTGKGVLINGATGIVPGSIPTSAIASGAITSALIGSGVIEGSNIDPTTTISVASWNTTGNAVVGGGLTVDGNETVDGNLTVDGNTTLGNSTSDSVDMVSSGNLLKLISSQNVAVNWGVATVTIPSGDAGASTTVNHGLGGVPQVTLATFAPSGSQDVLFELEVPTYTSGAPGPGSPTIVMNFGGVEPTTTQFTLGVTYGAYYTVGTNVPVNVNWLAIG